MSEESVLPEESEAQEIGQKAISAFHAKKPSSWRLTPLDANDFGLDFQVQIVKERKLQNIFRAQLKGTESPDLNASGEFFSVTLKTSTVNYYDRITEPVMLVLCDLSVNPTDPSSCPLYYVWAKDEINRLSAQTSASSSDPATRTIRFPKANLLTSDLDISPVLDEHRRLHANATAFDKAVHQTLPETEPNERAQILEKLSGHIQRRGRGFIEALSTTAKSPWPEAPKESFAGKLNEIHQKLRIGATKSALLLLNSIEPDLVHAASMEQAEFWYLNGRILSVESSTQDAVDSLKKAHTIEPTVSKYLVAWVETEFRLRYEPGKTCDLSDLISQLTSNEPEVVALVAKLLSVSGREKEAYEKLETIPRKNALGMLAIIATTKSKTDSVISLCDEGLDDSTISDERKQLFHLLRARAKFNLALRINSTHDHDHVFPPTGPANLNIEMLTSAWEDIQVVAEMMRAEGWPSNIELFSDIWSATAVILGKHKDILPDVQEAAQARPTIIELQNALERIAIASGEFELAIEALARQPPGPDTTLRKIALLHQARRHTECIALIQSELPNLPQDHKMFPLCISLGVSSADQIIRTDIAEELYKILQSNPGWSEHVAVLDYFRARSQDQLRRDDALRKLEDSYERLDKPSFIGIHLFQAFNTMDASEARKCIVIAQDLRKQHQLDLEDTLQLAQAYTTTEDWDILLSLIEESMARFGKSGRLVAIKAFALDKLGRTPEAVVELKTLVASSTQEPIAVKVYINIVTRCGFTDEAIKLVESVLAKETQREKKLDYLRLLFGLVHQSDPLSQRPEEISWRIGKITNQDDEAEEGLFIITYLTATLSPKVVLNEERKKEFQRRIGVFTKRWPKSKILRSAELPKELTSDSLEKMLESVFGDTREMRAAQSKMAAQLERGELPIPFAWRPRNILTNVSDVPALWEIAKNSKKDARQYHLTMAHNEWQPVDPKILIRHTPLIDLITLLVIKDLELFDTLFSIFPQIAISQNTLLELQRLTQPMAGSWARQQCLDVISILKEHFSQIIQPTVAKTDDLRLSKNPNSEELKKLILGKRFMLYSDDALFRIYSEAPNDGPPTICTLDLLSAADYYGYLSAQEAARCIGLLCKWNVEIIITQRLIFGSIPESVDKATSVDSAIEALRTDVIAKEIFEGIWNVRKPYPEILANIGSIIATLVSEPKNNIQVIAAIWGLWFLKAKLRADVKITPALRHLVLSMAKAAQGLELKDTQGIRTLWQVFLKLVQVEFGERMDERREKEAIQLVGIVTAEIDASAPSSTSTNQLEAKLIQGLTDGTAYYDWFSQAYSNHRITLVAKSKRSS